MIFSISSGVTYRLYLLGVGPDFKCWNGFSSIILRRTASFLAYDTRLKRVYKRVNDGSLELRDDLPSPIPMNKPWLRSVTITGGTSFFTDQSDPSRAQVFQFNPDLTCIIGARMSGKSALLDGLRNHCELAAPTDAVIARDSRERFEHVFNSGEPTVALGILSLIAETMHPRERRPARCFSQREIESAANDPDVRRDLLFRLLPREADGLTARERRLDELGDELRQIPNELNRLRAEFHEKWSAFVESREAAQAILRFKKAGIGKLRKVQQQHGLLVDFSQTLDSSAPQLRGLIAEVDPGDLKDVAVSSALDLKGALRRYKLALRVARHYGRIAKALVQDCLSDSDVQCDHARREVIARIVAAGGTAQEIQQFEALAQLASNVEITRRSLHQVSERVKAVQHGLRNAVKEREQLRHEQGRALKRLEYTIARRFEDRIRIRVLCDRINDKLTEWILSLRSAPVTTWWNKLKATNEAPTPQKLMQALCARKKTTPSRSLSISEAVWNNLVTAADETHIDELSTTANDNDYRVELRIDKNRGIYKDISKLSGGARVSVVLSLILEGDDHSPLVIDQPEDQLDRRFLFRDLLPAIHRRKSKAQIILATHDANLVVNGDADLVVWLDADGERGWVKRAHAIDDSEIRDAVLEVLDGGEEAFQLRRAKYGF